MSRLQHTPITHSRLAAVIFLGLCLVGLMILMVTQ